MAMWPGERNASSHIGLMSTLPLKCFVHKSDCFHKIQCVPSVQKNDFIGLSRRRVGVLAGVVPAKVTFILMSNFGYVTITDAHTHCLLKYTPISYRLPLQVIFQQEEAYCTHGRMQASLTLKPH